MNNKLLQIKRKLSDNKKRAVALLLVGTLILGLAPLPQTTVKAVEPTNPIPEEGGYFTETNTGDMNRVPYNNEGLTVDLSASVFGTIMVADNNGDNVLDIIVSTTCKGIPVASSVFYGKAGSQEKGSAEYMVMNKAVAASGNKSLAEQAYGSCVYNTASGKNEGYKNSYVDTIVTQSAWTHGTGSTWPWAVYEYNFELPSVVPGSTEIAKYQEQIKYEYGEYADNNIEITLAKEGYDLAPSYSFADYDGDGDLDLLYSISTWVDLAWVYGEPSHYNDNGVWDTNGDGIEDRVHGYVYWFENKTTYSENTPLIETAKRNSEGVAPTYGEPKIIKVYDENGEKANPLDTYSHPEAKMYDFDNDGDLDIACGSFIDEITYYENVQVQENLDMPKFKEGRPFVDEALNPISAEYMNLSIAAADWDNDGWMDLLVSEEDTRIFLLRNTGKKDQNNTPIMEAPQYFQQDADSIKGSSLATTYSIDWDGDGDEDLIMGGGAGFISYYENLSIVEENGEYVKKRDLSDPSWAAPVRFTDTTGKEYLITARMEDGGTYGSIQGPFEQRFGYTKVTAADWDGDGILDIMSNNVRGEVYLHRGTAKGSTALNTAELIKVEWENGYKIPSWYDKPYDQRKTLAEQGYLITQWRTTPFMIDLPTTDSDGDGVAEGDKLMDLVMLDHEGYLAFFERYEENGELKLREGKRIFKDSNGSALGLRADTQWETYNDGKSGRRQFTMVDWDLDGDLDLIVDDQVNRWNVEYRENISTTPGEYKFADPYSMHTRCFAYHEGGVTVCDWNQDGIPDLLVSAESGFVYYLKNTSVKTPEESLVAHWDFEGDTEEIALQDKATAGETNNTLSKGGSVTIHNGVATIDADGYLKALNDTDLSQGGEMTIFMRTKVSGGNGWFPLLTKAHNYTGYNYKVVVQQYDGVQYPICFDMTTSNWGNAGGVGNQTLPADEWRELAFVVSEDNGEYYYQMFMSKEARTGTGSDFIAITDKVLMGAYGPMENAVDLLIGNDYTQSSADDYNIGSVTSTRKFDDVRIYDTALTTEQLATLLPAVNPDENLVAHWDFDGDETTSRQDKAGSGSMADDLTIGGTEGNVVIQNGVATINGDGYLMANDGADLDLSGEMTIFLRAYVSGGNGWTGLLHKAHDMYGYNYKLGVGQYDGVQYPLNSEITCADWSGVSATGTTNLPSGEWHELACVVSESNGEYYYQMFMSKKARTASGSDFIPLTDKISMGTYGPMANDVNLLIGNAYTIEGDNLFVIGAQTTERKFDDVRIYNKALTTDQLATLLPAVNLGENLVAHWDFDGDTEEIALQDKATAGETNNTLSKGGSVTIHNGVATIDADGYLKALNDTDLSQGGEMTIFMRTKVSGGNGWFPLLTKAHNYTGYNYKVVVQQYDGVQYPICFDMTTSNWGSAGGVGNQTLPADEWRELAFVVSEDNGEYYYQMFMSKEARTGTGSDFIAITDKVSMGAYGPMENAVDLLIGNDYTQTSADDYNIGSVTSTRKFDDVRIYNTALTPDQLAKLLPAVGSDDNLVAHWDFDGDEATSLQDKATGGDVNDNLVKAGDENTVTVSDGIVAIKHGGWLQAADSSDLDQGGEMTLLMRVFIEKDGEVGIIDKASGAHYAIKFSRWEDGRLAYRVSDGTNDISILTTERMPSGEWRELAMVVSKDEAGYLTYEMFMSKESSASEADDFVSLGKVTATYTKEQVNDEPLMIGNNYENHLSNRPTIYFDDVQIHSAALTTEELASALGELPEEATHVQSLEIVDTQPICTTVGDASVLDTVVVAAHFKNTTKYVTLFGGVEFTGFNSSVTGTQDVTVSYGGCQTSITIRVYDYGDIDGNGTSNVTDLVRLKKIEAGQTTEGYVPTDMNVRKLHMHLLGCDTALATLLNGKNVSILGDSISTYQGYSNNGNANSTTAGNAVYYSDIAFLSDVKYTWWKQLAMQTNMNLLVNNSHSGGRVGGHEDDLSYQGINRALELHNNEGSNPDVIVVYLGVNDLVRGSTVEQFTQDYTTMIKGMTEKYSEADVFVMTHIPNTYTVAHPEFAERLPGYNAAIKQIAETYNCTVVDLYEDSGITLENHTAYMADVNAYGGLHPNAKGMDLITRTVYFAMCEKYLGM